MDTTYRAKSMSMDSGAEWGKDGKWLVVSEQGFERVRQE
jgi:hypothetical protein